MRHLALALALPALTASMLIGQTPSTFAQTSPSAPPDGRTATVTGCLRAGEQPGTFVLVNARWSEPSGGAAKDAASHHDATLERDRPTTPATAVTPQKETPRLGETLRLAGAAAKMKLSEHLGHTVTVTGMLMPQDPVARRRVLLPDASKPGDTTSRTGSGEEKGAAFPRVLNVRSLTHVAAECK